MSFSSLPSGSNEAIKPFKIEASREVLDELKTLIKYSKIAVPTFENSRKDGNYGLDREWMQNIKDKWIQSDWSKTQVRLNSFPHFKASVTDDDGTKYDIHFAALFSQKTDAVPLMMLHGWPGSFLEFMPIFQLLKDKYTPDTLPYHVIVPSLPGYAFSSGPRLDKNFGIEDVARILDRLMSMLGFGAGYVAQGGDIGSRVGRYLATAYPGCKGKLQSTVHVNFMIPTPPSNTPVDELTTAEKQGLARGMDFFKFGIAYALEHGTRPSTIGLVLASNPMALMAWIGEKFQQWSDITPSDETIIEFLTLYWVTNTIERCIYPYRGDFPDGVATIANAFVDNPSPAKPSVTRDPASNRTAGYVDKPMGFSSFPKELAVTPKSWAASQGNLVFYRVHDTGGHFAALEKPELLLKDVEDFVAEVWKSESEKRRQRLVLL